MRPMGLMRGIGPITPLSSIEGKGNHKILTQLHRQFGKTTSRIFNIFLTDIYLSIQKNFAITEGTRFQLRADLINAFNHPQYISGTPNSVTPIATTAVGNVNTATSTQFNRPDLIFSSNPRLVQLSARLIF